MKNLAPAPGLAHRAADAELRLIEVRDLDGHLLRRASLAQAELLVSAGAAYPIIGERGWREVRLLVALPPHSNRPFYGRVAACKANLKNVFRHNDRACEIWGASEDPSREGASDVQFEKNAGAAK